MGQIPCIAGFLDMNNKRIDRSIVSMLRSIFDELGLFHRYTFIFPSQGCARVFKSENTRCLQEIKYSQIHTVINHSCRGIICSSRGCWAILRIFLPFDAEINLCRNHSAEGQKCRLWECLLTIGDLIYPRPFVVHIRSVQPLSKM